MARNRNGRADSATDNGSTTSGQSSLAQLSIRTSIPAIKDLTVAFLTDPKTPPSLKILCWAGAIGEIVVISLSVLLIGLGNPILGFSLAVLGILLIAVIIWVVFKLVSRGLIAIASQNPPSSPRPDPTWTRVVPMIPIKEVLLEQIHEKLENIRSLAYEKIEGFDVNAHTIKREYVRANIFLPDTGAVVTEGICELYIPKKLHVGMDPENDADRDRCERERNIRFKPNQGAAGVAFMETNTELARAVKIDTARYTWAEKYSLTESQKRAIHPELKWVISFPMTLNDGGNFRAMGVLNVDGLIRELAEDQLKILMGELSLKVMTISGLLAQNEKCRISLFVESM